MNSVQPSLFDPQDRVPYAPKSRTSIEAARRQTNAIGGAKAIVLAVLRKHPEGLTDWQGWPLSDIRQESTYRARRIGLVEMGLVVDSGRSDENKDHLASTVWVTLENALGDGKTTAQVAAMTNMSNAEAWSILTALESDSLVRQDDVLWVKR